LDLLHSDDDEDDVFELELLLMESSSRIVDDVSAVEAIKIVTDMDATRLALRRIFRRRKIPEKYLFDKSTDSAAALAVFRTLDSDSPDINKALAAAVA